MLYSIVVISYQRPVYVQELVSQLLVQIGDLPVELLVMVDGDEMPSLPKEVRVEQHVKPLGASANRNRGAALARGKWLIFLDDDVTLPKDWLKNTIACLKQAKASLYFGAVRYQKKLPRFPDRIVSNETSRWPLGAFVMVEKEDFLQVGGFISGWDDLHNEDTEFALRCLSSGIPYEVLHSPFVVHRHDVWKAETLVATARYIGVVPKLVKHYPKHWQMLPFSRIGRVMYPKELMLLLTSPIMFPLSLLYTLLRPSLFVLHVAKWRWLALRRLFLWKQALHQGVFLV